MAGTFIVFEGPEGAGKSTQIAHLARHLEREGHAVRVTREPGGTPAGEAVRRVVLDPDLEIDALGEFLLYSASRAQLVGRVLRPALEHGEVVVCDRYAAASVAYQGYGRGLDLELIADLTEVATGGLRPHLTVLLDLPPEEGLRRVTARGAHDRLEAAGLGFHRRVRDGFLRQAAAQGDWLVLDATRSEDELQRAVWRAVQGRLEVGA